MFLYVVYCYVSNTDSIIAVTLHSSPYFAVQSCY